MPRSRGIILFLPRQGKTRKQTGVKRLFYCAVVKVRSNKKKDTYTYTHTHRFSREVKLSNRIDFDFEGSTGGSLSPVTSLALNSLTGTPLNGLQDSLSNAYSSLQQYAGKRAEPSGSILFLFLDLAEEFSILRQFQMAN